MCWVPKVKSSCLCGKHFDDQVTSLDLWLKICKHFNRCVHLHTSGTGLNIFTCNSFLTDSIFQLNDWECSSVEAVVRLKKSSRILLGTYNCPSKCSLRRAIGLVRGPWIPLHVQCWPPPGLFLDVLLVPCVVDIQQLWVCGSGSFTWSSRS